MPDTKPDTPAGAARVVLFGLPRAGKTSLLGALARAADSQARQLAGSLTSSGGALEELRDRVYEDGPGETKEEVVPYPVHYDPADPDAGGLDAVLVDCDGRAANQLLSAHRPLDGGPTADTLAANVRAADALVLVVDAAADGDRLDADFAEFARFLGLFQETRGRRSEVGGLPVFLVLTKCDLLARPGDTAAAWIERIEDRKRQVGDRFREFLARRSADGLLPFGRLDLHLWATAIKRPDLEGAPARPREPFGVAELFRLVLEQARAFRRRSRRSGRRLAWTALGGLTLLAGLAVGAGLLLTQSEPEQPTALLNKVGAYRSREGQVPSARLREPLQAKVSELSDLTNDPDFARLPADERRYVEDRLRELQDYRAYKQKLLGLRPPAEAADERDLAQIEATWLAALPDAAYRDEWEWTEAAVLRRQQLEDVKALRAAAAELADWYRQLIRRGEELLALGEPRSSAAPPVPWRDWIRQVSVLLDEAALPPHAPAERLPGSPRLTYADAARFGPVAEGRVTWEALRGRLTRLRDVTAALGLAGDAPDRPALLDVPVPPAFTAAQARARVQALEKAYPSFPDGFRLANLPEAVTGEVRRAAKASYDRLLQSGREVVHQKLQEASPEGREMVEGWRRLIPWLNDPADLEAWRVLATVLGRLHDPGATDPVTDLAAFLRRDRFELDLRNVVLEIPDDVRVRPAGALTISHQPFAREREPLQLEPQGDPQRDLRRRVTSYSFRPPPGTGSLTYRPGDGLWAELPVKDADNRDLRLTWSRGRSDVFQFERLSLPPRLHPPGEEGAPATGVRLLSLAGGGWPQVADLIPVVRLERR
jgi:hypothetical protein